jgi:hypothetical protein
VINLFRSEEALQEWLKRFPELKDRMRGPIPLALDFIKSQKQK